MSGPESKSVAALPTIAIGCLDPPAEKARGARSDRRASDPAGARRSDANEGKRMGRHIRQLALLAALLLTLTACGNGGDEGDTGNGEDGGNGGDGEQTEDLSGQSVEVAAVWTGTEQENFELVLDEFSAQTGAEVTYTSTGDDIAAVLGTRTQGGSPPDVAILPQPGLLVDFAEEGSLQPLEDIAGELVDEHYAPVWRELGTTDDTLYGVWFKAANKSTFWYNLNVYEDAGVEPPETWEDLQQVAETVGAFGVSPISVGGADGWTLTDWFENVYLRTAGGETYDQLVNHEIPWTDQSVKDALATLAEIFGNEAFLNGGQSGALNTDFVTSVTNTFADPPQASMVYEGDFVAGVIAGETQAELGTDADFFDFPSIDGSEPAVMGAGDVAVLFTENEAAEALIRFLASPDAGEIWAAQGGFTSPNQGVDTSVYPDDITRRSAEALTAAEVFRFDLSDLQPAAFGSTPGQGLFQLFQDFLRAPDDIDGITERMEAEAAAAFGS